MRAMKIGQIHPSEDGGAVTGTTITIDAGNTA
jgi:hypothetical protein